MVRGLHSTRFSLGPAWVPAVKAACASIMIVGVLRVAVLSDDVAPRIMLWIIALCAVTLAVVRAWTFLQGAEGPRSECGRCRRGTMERAATSVTGTRYYRCSLCGARTRRANPLAAFEDASSIEHDAIYVRRARHGGLEIIAPLDEPTYWTHTVVTLHRNQVSRRRHTAADARKPTKPISASRRTRSERGNALGPMARRLGRIGKLPGGTTNARFVRVRLTWGISDQTVGETERNRRWSFHDSSLSCPGSSRCC
jgi:hypothetical protein